MVSHPTAQSVHPIRLRETAIPRSRCSLTAINSWGNHRVEGAIHKYQFIKAVGFSD
uniref:Uncharacterized protein n=1 Tax=Arundo donax TaxID=35708 RepID=A0A0A9C1W8_ARUDO